ncbi:hypothetical protein [Paenibacillus ottowii]
MHIRPAANAPDGKAGDRGASPDIRDGEHPFFEKCIKTNGTFSSIEQQQAQTDKNKSSSLPLFVLEPVSYFLSEA